jgi:hypothetical protein
MSTGDPVTTTVRFTDDGIFTGLVRVSVHDDGVSMVMVPLDPAALTKADAEQVFRVTVEAPAGVATHVGAVSTALVVAISGTNRFQLRC